MVRRRLKGESAYRLWALVTLFALTLLFVIAMALWTGREGADPQAEWESINQEVEQVLEAWEKAEGKQVSYPTVKGKVPLNHAPAEQLQTLPGIGPSKAKAIVTYREEHGPFTAIEQLLAVKGIGEKTLAGLRDAVTLEAPAAASTP